MATVESLSNDIANVEKQLYSVKLTESALSTLKGEAEMLLASIKVVGTFREAASQLSIGEAPKRLQTRMSRFLGTLYTKPDKKNAEQSNKRNSEQNEIAQRSDKLRSLPCHPLLLIAVSYLPSDVFKMDSVQFDCLTRSALTYADSNLLPSRWLFREVFQKLMLGHIGAEGFNRLKQEYHKLEYLESNMNDERPRKRCCIESHAPTEETPDIQPTGSDHGHGDTEDQRLPLMGSTFNNQQCTSDVFSHKHMAPIFKMNNQV